MKVLVIFGWVAAFALVGERPAAAAERHFGGSFESSVLKPGAAELQPWTTVRAGRADYFSRLDARLGFQFGIAGQLQAALFWNAYQHTEDIHVSGATEKSRLSTTQFESLTAQLKLRFSDAVTDTVGSAVLVDGIFGPQLVGYEARLIVDRQFGSWLVAGNLVGGTLTQLDLRSSTAGSFGVTLAAGYFLSPSFALGLEARNENGFTGRFDHSVTYAGPALSFASDRYWLLLAADAQLPAFKGASAGHWLDLHENEYLQARFVLGFRL